VQRGLRKELICLALVMDGNRRWAEAGGLTTAEGYEAGRWSGAGEDTGAPTQSLAVGTEQIDPALTQK